MTSKRAAPRGTVGTVGSALIALALLTGCGMHADAAVRASGAIGDSTAAVHDGEHGAGQQFSTDAHSRGSFPCEEGLDDQQLLARTMGHPGLYGAVVGTVLDSGEASLADPAYPSSVMTGYRFQVEQTVGARGRLFDRDGIEVLVPGGELGSTVVEDDDAPEFDEGERVLLFAQFESLRPTAAGRSSRSRLVVVSSDNVARIDGDQITWAGWTTSVKNFLDTLDAHPSRRDPARAGRTA